MKVHANSIIVYFTKLISALRVYIEVLVLSIQLT